MPNLTTRPVLVNKEIRVGIFKDLSTNDIGVYTILLSCPESGWYIDEWFRDVDGPVQLKGMWLHPSRFKLISETTITV